MSAVVDHESDLHTYLRDLRRVASLTLRGVETRTSGAVKNSYLSQIESGRIKRPSPEVLWHLAQVYAVDYNDLLERAGHRSVPTEAPPAHTVAGIPLSALTELDEDDQQALVAYVEFLRSRKKRSPS